MINTRARLHALKAKHGLKPRDIACMCGVSLVTAHSWLRPESNHAARKPPAMAIKLIERQLSDFGPDC